MPSRSLPPPGGVTSARAPRPGPSPRGGRLSTAAEAVRDHHSSYEQTSRTVMLTAGATMVWFEMSTSVLPADWTEGGEACELWSSAR